MILRNLSLLIALTASLVAGELQFDSQLKAVTLKPDQTRTEILFPFKNASDKDITIMRYDAPCSCMSAKLKGGQRQSNGTILFKPGESGVVKGIFVLENMKGTVDKQIVLWLNDDKEDEPSVVLTAKVTIPELIKADPISLQWDLNAPANTQEIIITVSDASPINLVKDECSSPLIDYQIVTKRPGFEYVLKVTPKKTDQIVFGAIRFKTDSKNPRFQSLQTFVTIKPPKK